MKKTSIIIFLVLLLINIIVAGLSVYFFYEDSMFSNIANQEGYELPVSKEIIALANMGIILVIYGILGFIGIILSRKIDFPEIWDKQISLKQRFLYPTLVGILLGIILILGDLIFSQFNTIGKFIHPDFPLSIFASISAGIGEEILFRLFFIPFLMWIFYVLIFKKTKGKNVIFWIVTIASAIVFSIIHLPAIMITYNFSSLSDISIIVLVEILLLNGLLSVFAAYYFRKYGFIAPVMIHFVIDIVWHVIYGSI